jgi:dTDP-4-amino-4,6-dideoxygalactose transaminase
MIPYGRQSIDDEDIASVVEALKSDFLTTGPLVERFENAIEEFTGIPAVVVSSGTAALHCAYSAIGLTAGDEVITPPLTFIATQATAAYFGAKIVFADIELTTGNIDPELVARAITRRTKAIVAVDYAGHPADLDVLRQIADEKSLYLIEDAAHSFGSTHKGLHVGSVADLTTFSFFPTKNITTGEGGAIVSKDAKLLEKVRLFSRQGLVRNPSEFRVKDQGPWHQEVHEFGLNYRLPDILCALGISQLSKANQLKQKRKEIFDTYTSRLRGVNGLILPHQEIDSDVNWHLYPIRVQPEARMQIFNELRRQGIGVQVNYMPAHWHPVFYDLGHRRGDFPLSELFYESEISLPMYPNLEIDQVHAIADKLLQIIDNYKNE